MEEIAGNIWNYHTKGYWIVVTTNGTLKRDGTCVMGRGIALQAKQRFPDLPHRVGTEIRLHGNNVFLFEEYRIITFPVKRGWWEKADIGLIENSAIHLASFIESNFAKPPVYMVRPGCGNGGLDWKDVKPVIEKYLDNRFIVVEQSMVTDVTELSA